MGRTTTAEFGANLATAAPTPRQIQTEGKVAAGGGIYEVFNRHAELTPDQAQTLIGAMDQFSPAIQAQRRGRRSWDVTEQAALAKIQKDFGLELERLVALKPGTAVNAEELYKFGLLVGNQTVEVQNLARRARETGSHEDKLAYLAANEKLGMVLVPTLGATTEVGRAMNILQKVVGVTRAAEAIVAVRGEAGMADLEREIERVAEMNPQAAVQHTQETFGQNWLNRFWEVYINGLLSALGTHVTNLVSTGLYLGMEEAVLAGTLVTGGIDARAFKARHAALLDGIKQGAANAITMWKAGESQFGGGTRAEGRPTSAWVGSPLEPYITAPSRAMGAEDEFLKTVIYTMSWNQLAMEKAIRQRPDNPEARFAEIKSAAAAPEHVELWQEAQDEAMRLTFNRSLGAFGNSLMRLRSMKVDTLPMGILQKFISMQMPFIRTPTNILKATADYVPGVGMLRQENLAAMREGGQDRQLVIARQLVGGAMAFMIAEAVAAGLLTAGGPDDPNEREVWLVNHKPWSVKFGDKWVSYNRFEPLGMLVGLFAQTAQLWNRANEQEKDNLVALLFEAVASNLRDKTYLSGPIKLAGALWKPEQYAADWAEQQVGSVIPYTALLSEVSRALDPTRREINTVLDSIQARIPGLRQNLPAKIDITGQPIPEGRPIPGQPMNIYAQRRDPVAQAMLDVGGDIARHRSPNDRQFGVELTDAEHEDFARWMGEQRFAALRPMVESPGWRALKERNPTQAGIMLERRWDKASERAKLQWLARNQQVIMRRRMQDADRRNIHADQARR